MFGSYVSKLTPTLYKFGYSFINSQIRNTFNTQQIWNMTLKTELFKNVFFCSISFQQGIRKIRVCLIWWVEDFSFLLQGCIFHACITPILDFQNSLVGGVHV